MHTFIGTPLRYRSRILGELYLADKHGDALFTADDELVLEALAAEAGTAYWNAQLLAAERRVSAQVTALLDARESGDARQAAFRRLVWAEEEERARVGRELHDGLGQILTSAALYAKGIEESVDGELAERVTALRGLVERAMVSTRALVRGLRPPELDNLGLLPALERLTVEVRDAHGLQVDLHGTDVDVPCDVETAVYRITQEALSNVVRHARASWASVVVGRHDGNVVVVVEDDGQGFDREALAAHGMRGEQLGLLGMGERAAAVGARLTVDSEPGHGTLVRLEIPVAGENHRDVA
jgi:two-component system sensor histidine kinase UhpB